MLFLVGSGVLASLLFSLVVFYEMAEQPFNLLDTVLEEEGTRVVRSLVTSPAVMLGERDWQKLGMEQYWLELRDREAGTLLFPFPAGQRVAAGSFALRFGCGCPSSDRKNNRPPVPEPKLPACLAYA